LPVTKDNIRYAWQISGAMPRSERLSGRASALFQFSIANIRNKMTHDAQNLKRESPKNRFRAQTPYLSTHK